MPWEYSDKVLQLFQDAVRGKAGTHMGIIENPDGFGEHGSIVCGDALRFSFRVKRHPTDPTRDVITEARYQTFGCTSAIAASEALCALLEEGQKTPIAALHVTNQDLIEYLGGLPDQKIHCSVMGAEALQTAVIDWAQKRGVDVADFLPQLIKEEQEEGRIVCRCFAASEPYLRRKIRELGLRTIPEITNALKAGGGCTTCHHQPGGLQDLLDEIWGTHAPVDSTPTVAIDKAEADRLSPYQLGKRVEQVIATHIRSLLRAEGGDIELVDIQEDRVYCRLTGTCSACPGADQTLKMLVERHLKELVDERLRVIAV